MLLDLLGGHAPRYSSYVFCPWGVGSFCRVGLVWHSAPCLFSSPQEGPQVHRQRCWCGIWEREGSQVHTGCERDGVSQAVYEVAEAKVYDHCGCMVV